jgi:hypothetical protein
MRQPAPTLSIAHPGVVLQGRYQAHHIVRIQLIGRARYVLFPPAKHSSLFLFPAIHSCHGQSQVTLSFPPSSPLKTIRSFSRRNMPISLTHRLSKQTNNSRNFFEYLIWLSNWLPESPCTSLLIGLFVSRASSCPCFWTSEACPRNKSFSLKPNLSESC